jgi:hypothetical protein
MHALRAKLDGWVRRKLLARDPAKGSRRRSILRHEAMDLSCPAVSRLACVVQDHALARAPQDQCSRQPRWPTADHRDIH